MLTKDKQLEFYKKLGKSLRDARNHAGLKQEYVASQIGLTRTSLVNIEQGIQKIQIHALMEIVNILKIDIKEILPDLDKIQSAYLSKGSENRLSKQLDKEVENTENAIEILKDFIKLSESKTGH